MNRTDLKMEELEQVAGGSVLEFFYQDLGFDKVVLWWEVNMCTKGDDTTEDDNKRKPMPGEGFVW